MSREATEMDERELVKRSNTPLKCRNGASQEASRAIHEQGTRRILQTTPSEERDTQRIQDGDDLCRDPRINLSNGEEPSICERHRNRLFSSHRSLKQAHSVLTSQSTLMVYTIFLQ